MPTTSGAITRFIDVDVIITGLPRIDGFDDGTSISIDWQGDWNTIRPGNDGLDSFAAIAGRSALVTLSLMETSNSNRDLWQWLKSGFGRSVSYLDRNSGTTIGGALCHIQKPATISKTANVEVASWVILCSQMDGVWGRYPNPAPAP